MTKKAKETAGKTAAKGMLPDAAFAWVRELELNRPTSRTMVLTAAVVALRLLESEEQDEAFKWAKLLCDESVDWDEFVAACHENQAARRKALQRLVQSVFDGSRPEHREIAPKRA